MHCSNKNSFEKKKTLTCLNDHVNHAAGHGICLTIHPLKWEAATNSHTKLSSVHIKCCILFRGISTVTASLQNGHQYLCMLSDVDLLEISDWGLNKNKVKTTLTQTGMLPKFHTVAFPCVNYILWIVFVLLSISCIFCIVSPPWRSSLCVPQTLTEWICLQSQSMSSVTPSAWSTPQPWSPSWGRTTRVL